MLDFLLQSTNLVFGIEDDAANIHMQTKFTAQRLKKEHDVFHFDKFTRTISALLSVWY